MGYNKRRDQNEAMADLEKERRYVQNMTLGGICAAGIITLNVACMNCPRRGRYRVTRLVDRYGAGLGLPDLKTLLAADCREKQSPWPQHSCAVYFPGLAPSKVRPL
jgi:hypothetical protein